MPPNTPSEDKQPDLRSLEDDEARELCHFIEKRYGRLLGANCPTPEAIESDPKKVLNDVATFLMTQINDLQRKDAEELGTINAIKEFANQIIKTRGAILAKRPPK